MTQGGKGNPSPLGPPNVLALRIGRREIAARSESGIVDDEVDRSDVITDAIGNCFLTIACGQVGGDHLDAIELHSQRVEPGGPPSRDNNRHAAGAQLAGDLLTDPARRPCHEAPT